MLQTTATADPIAPDDAHATEAALVQAAIGGDKSAFERIYQQHGPRLYAVLWRLCGGNAARAEDALQEAFIAAWKALPGFRQESRLATWLHRLGVNAALMDLRRQGGLEAVDDSEAVLQHWGDTTAASGCQATGLDLERAVATLPPRARAVLVLHDIEGWKHQEIAIELEMAVGTSKAQLHRARSLLRERLGGSP